MSVQERKALAWWFAGLYNCRCGSARRGVPAPVACSNTAEHFLDINHIMLWDLEKGTALADFQKPGLVITGGAFVGDRYLFGAASGNQLTLWSIR